MLVVVIAVLTVLCGCVSKLSTDEEKIENRIECFLEAYNSGDINGVLDCMDSQTKNTYKSAMNITNAVSGKMGIDVSFSDLFGLSVGIMSDGDMLALDNMQTEILSDESAKVYADMSYHDKVTKNGTPQKVCIVMQKEKSDWFIRDMK